MIPRLPGAAGALAASVAIASVTSATLHGTSARPRASQSQGPGRDRAYALTHGSGDRHGMQQDDFGLGTSTYATSRSPINLDAVESASLVASGYAVSASGFTGGLVNITTRPGTNEWERSRETGT
ncbi:MAG: hypothetical protein OXH52_18460 [Gammaproteobacteria bacterium]|nr:hypothetical protein [Gammaproteobacteria bacterium]